MSDHWITEVVNEIDLWDTGQKQEMIRKNKFGESFKLGEKVLIKSWCKEFENQSPTYTPEMRQYEHQVATIRHFDEADYGFCYLEEEDLDEFCWHIDWLTKPEHLPKELFDI